MRTVGTAGACADLDDGRGGRRRTMTRIVAPVRFGPGATRKSPNMRTLGRARAPQRGHEGKRGGAKGVRVNEDFEGFNPGDLTAAA